MRTHPPITAEAPPERPSRRARAEAWLYRAARFATTPWAAAMVFAAAAAVYALGALPWPVTASDGRDTDSYLMHYLELGRGDPVFPSLMYYRTPLTGLMLGPPLQAGGLTLLELWLGVLFATSVVLYFRSALFFGALPAALTAIALLLSPSYGAMYHEVSSDPVFCFFLAVTVWLVVRAVRRPDPTSFALVGAGVGALALTRPANITYLVFAAAVVFISVSWKRRAALAGSFLAVALGLVLLWAGHNSVRYGQFVLALGDNFPSAQRLRELSPDGLGPKWMQAHAGEKRTGRTLRGRASKFWDLLNEDLVEARAVYPPWSITRTLPHSLNVWVPDDAHGETGPRIPWVEADTRLPLAAWVLAEYESGLKIMSRPSATEPAIVFPDSAKQRRYLADAKQILEWEHGAREPRAKRLQSFFNWRLSRVFPPAWAWLLVALAVGLWRRMRDTGPLFALVAGSLLVVVATAIIALPDAHYVAPMIPLFAMLAFVVTTGRLVPRSRRGDSNPGPHHYE